MQVAICKWSKDSSDIFAGGPADEPVYQLQIMHDHRPSITFGFLAAMRAFVPTYEGNAQTLDELEQTRRIRFAVAGGQGQDPDHVGVKPWRVAVYIGGATPVPALDLLAAFVRHKASTLEFQATGVPALHVVPRVPELLGGQVPEPWVEMAAGSVEAHPFDAPPPRGRRHVILMLEKEDATERYSVVVSGNTWAYRDRFEAAAVAGGYIDEESAGREYVRVLRDLTVDDAGRARVEHILEAGVLHGQAVYLEHQIDAQDDPMLKWLTTMPTVFTR